jgi:hypothetical protein
MSRNLSVLISSLSLGFLLSGCLNFQTAEISARGKDPFKGAQKCKTAAKASVPQKTVQKINRTLANAGREISSEFCSNLEQYECYRRVFSPKAIDGRKMEEECGQLEEFNGKFCIPLAVRYYNTSLAASLPETPSSDLEEGGEFNRSEYVCHQKDLRDEDQFLALSTGEGLKEALLGAFKQCGNIAPQLQTLGEKK